jgi:FKBP-type peptidyl-prolyl cis-trans isomerase FklB
MGKVQLITLIFAILLFIGFFMFSNNNSEVSKANITEGVEFLTNNANKKGIVTLDSGLQYKILTDAEGDKPNKTSNVTVHYRGTTLNGTEFDSSYSRNAPATFPLNRVIAGWTEGVQLMSEGAKYRFFIPSDLAYGAQGAGGDIGPHATLIFEVELLNIQ